VSALLLLHTNFCQKTMYRQTSSDMLLSMKSAKVVMAGKAAGD
jgi:hypothetical protein